METPHIKNGVQVWSLDSWTQYYDFVSSRFSNSPAYIFRGQADASWTIKSSLDRLEEKHPTTPNFAGNIPKQFDCPPAPRDVHLLAFRQSMLGRPNTPVPPEGDDECWALAQHHGLATPMLDWTLSPFVALYFAFEHYVEAENRVVLAVSTSIINEKEESGDPAPLPFLPKNEASHRLLAHSSRAISKNA